MTSNSDPTQHSGGCQCRAVRFRITGPISEPALCHCRKCQLQFGNYFSALGTVDPTHITWLGDLPTLYRSSPVAQRGFCRACGTPLTFHYDSEPNALSIALACLDDPAAVMPERQDGIEARMPWIDELHRLPALTTEDSTDPNVLARMA